MPNLWVSLCPGMRSAPGLTALSMPSRCSAGDGCLPQPLLGYEHCSSPGDHHGHAVLQRQDPRVSCDPNPKVLQRCPGGGFNEEPHRAPLHSSLSLRAPGTWITPSTTCCRWWATPTARCRTTRAAASSCARDPRRCVRGRAPFLACKYPIWDVDFSLASSMQSDLGSAIPEVLALFIPCPSTSALP